MMWRKCNFLHTRDDDYFKYSCMLKPGDLLPCDKNECILIKILQKAGEYVPPPKYGGGYYR